MNHPNEIQSAVIRDVEPLLSGAILKCQTCRRTIKHDHLSAYFHIGWPKCCRYTMRLITRNEPDHPANEEPQR